MRCFSMAARKVSRSKRGSTTTVAPCLRRVHQGRQPVDVEEGQHREDALALARQEGHQLRQIGGDGPVREHHPLGYAGRPGGVRQGRDVRHRVDVDLRVRARSTEQVDQRAMPRRAVDEDLPHSAGEFGGLPRRLQEGRHGHDPVRGAVPQLLGQLLGRGERVHGRDRRPRARGGVERRRESDGVRAVQGEDVTLCGRPRRRTPRPAAGGSGPVARR